MIIHQTQPTHYRSRGFTLIELLIVIVIIGILSVSLIPRLKGLQDKAKYTIVQKDFNDFRTAVFLAQSITNQTLREITGTDCSRCKQCYRDIRKIDEGSLCFASWRSTLRKIEVAANLGSCSLSGLEHDPWGSPYFFGGKGVTGI